MMSENFEAYKNGYQAGYDNGYSDGNSAGFDNGMAVKEGILALLNNVRPNFIERFLENPVTLTLEERENFCNIWKEVNARLRTPYYSL